MQLQNALIIIESPNKIDKITKITGAKVFATGGHFKELSKAVIKDTESYEPILEFKENKKNYIYEILKNAEGKDIYIATDPDREGYAIGYLFYEFVKSKNQKVLKEQNFLRLQRVESLKALAILSPFYKAM
ncbi:toprim domain-containing protein [Helicobacter sp. MIT 11-5569]|uniref:toprim domain-containing protein n=1 Tax=Helicobacter sp. MIT 11-5569 TaxID=1548151 RepID=UPI000A7B72F6|nr:toprim domain-containing protein [Helicobacter sp. MIT 11-5569]